METFDGLTSRPFRNHESQTVQQNSVKLFKFSDRTKYASSKNIISYNLAIEINTIIFRSNNTKTTTVLIVVALATVMIIGP